MGNGQDVIPLVGFHRPDVVSLGILEGEFDSTVPSVGATLREEKARFTPCARLRPVDAPMAPNCVER